MSETAIRVRGLGKRYQLGAMRSIDRQLKEVIGDSLTRIVRGKSCHRDLAAVNQTKDDEFWALRNVDFDLAHGEVLGIVGRNGAGKSTLLKILSRITDPTEGEARIYGRVGSLLEVGTGFHPELTGRENIYLNGSIIGMSRAEIKGKFDEIVEFSGVKRFLDTPVKRYSSGMTVRLAFSVAAHLEPEILIVDEVLAVGDVEFQKQCLGKMQNVAKHGRTILFVSHNMGLIQQLCTRAIVLRNGESIGDGPARDMVQQYLAQLHEASDTAFDRNNPDRAGLRQLEFTGSRLIGPLGSAVHEIVAGEPASLELAYINHVTANRATINLTIFNQIGIPVTNLNSDLTRANLGPLGRSGKFRCHIPKTPFPPGKYRVAVTLFVDGERQDTIPNALVFDVTDSVFFPVGSAFDSRHCTVMVDHDWEICVENDTRLAIHNGS